ncbi:MAG TPA: heavy metal-associated domain-containing protein [Bryobacteraceae bacterium]|jgi:copper chaperone CopZ|nr:heavy metal-associated domain-containing protein [Bryobacteraceae bacterium]
MKEELTLAIDGMHCDACVRRVTSALQRVNGVNLDRVQVGSARLSFDPEETSPKEIAEAVDRIGFTATVKQ